MVQPKTQSAWETMSSGASLGGLGFTCYAPIRQHPAGEAALRFDIVTQDTFPLVSFLARNQGFFQSGGTDPFQRDLQQARTESVYPVCASTATAATLGLFAFKDFKMDILEFSCEGVVNKDPPILHPMGYFWLLKGVSLAEKIEAGYLKVRKAAVEMVIVTLQAPEKHSSVVKQAALARLQERKRRLEHVIESSQKKIREDQRDLDALRKEIKKLAVPDVSKDVSDQPDAPSGS